MDDATELGAFVIDRHIGGGGMGDVFRGEHRPTGVPVAVKVLRRPRDEDHRRRFYREVQAHAGLLHPHIVYLFEYGEVDRVAARESGGALQSASPYLAMELADQGTLRDAMPVEDWESVCRVLVEVLDALAHAHAREVLHRDLKPENMLRFDANTGADVPWHLSLTDFGVAHTFERERETDIAILKSPAGTPQYMAPEQLRGQWRAFGPWTDLYALGCVAWELVCGRAPFRENNVLQLALQHERAPRPPLEPRFAVPRGLERWIHRAMAAAPEHRFRRAADAAWALPTGVLQRAPEAVDGAPNDSKTTDTVQDAPTRPGAANADTRPASLDTTQLLETLQETSDSGGDVDPTADTQDPAAISETDAGEAPPDEQSDPAGGPPPDRRRTAVSSPLAPTPPMPEDWRTEATNPRSAPLVGAGLGLFGLREPPFVDREGPCDRIWSRLRRVADDQSSEFAFIAGAPGTGKSRLAEWIATRAHEVGAASVVRAVHTPSGGPGEGLRGALERHLRTLKLPRAELHEYLVDTLTNLEGEQTELVRRDARALTEYLRPTAESATDIDGPNYRFASADQRQALIARALERLASERPLLVWLDDLHWGRDAMGFLDYLQDHRFEATGLLVLSTLRSDILAERPRLKHRFEPWRRDRDVTFLRLEPLQRQDQRELLEGLLPLEPALAERLAERTEGHPLFAMQLLGHWIDGGDIEAGPEGFRVPPDRDLELPDDIHELWTGRLDRLIEAFSPEDRADARRSLELAAVLGREVSREEWETLLAETQLDPPSSLVDRLVERGLARRSEQGWSFAHGLLVRSLRQAAERKGRLQRHHRRCAEMLESTTDRRHPDDHERIADHWIAADEPERALEPLRDALEVSDLQSGIDEQRRLLERRNTLLDDLGIADGDPRRLEQQFRRARIESSSGNSDRVRTITTDLWNALGDDHVRLKAKTASLLSGAIRNQGQLEEAFEWARRGLAWSRRAEDHKLAGEALLQLAWTVYDRGDLENAADYAEQAAEAASRGDDRPGELQARRLRGLVGQARDEEDAEQRTRHVLREASEQGFAVVEAHSLNVLGESVRWSGRLEEARDYYQRYRQIMTELSRRSGAAMAELNLAQVEIGAGRPEAARRHTRAATSTLEQAGRAEHFAGLLHLLDLSIAAATEDAAAFAEHRAVLEDGWPDDWRLFRDHPWLLEHAADAAASAGWRDSARELLQLARDLWQRLGAADAVDLRLDGDS